MSVPKLANLALWGLAKQYQEGRAYHDPRDDPKTGPRYPSVTTVLKLVDKSGLSQWAADMAMRWAAENWELLSRRSDEDAFNAGRFRWKDVRDERAEVGTGVHETIEAEHKGTWTFPDLDEEQEAIIEQWRLLNESHLIEPILTEFTVLDTTVGYAGTADGYWKITCLHDGPTCLSQAPGEAVLAVVDVKTSRKHWPEHDYQLGALCAAPEWAIETGEMEWDVQSRRRIDAAAIIHLRADKHQIIEVPAIDLNASVFRSYLSAWRAREALKAWTKDHEKELAAATGFAGLEAA